MHEHGGRHSLGHTMLTCSIGQDSSNDTLPSIIIARDVGTHTPSAVQVLICASVMAQNATAVRAASAPLLAAVFCLHAGQTLFFTIPVRNTV